MPTAGGLAAWGSAGGLTSVSSSVSVDAGDLLLLVFQANSAIVGGPPSTAPIATGFGKTFVLMFSATSDNTLNTKYLRAFYRTMPDTSQTGSVTLTMSGLGWNTVAHLIRVQGVTPGADGANAIVQTAVANRGSVSGSINPILAGVQSTTSIAGLAAKNIGNWTGTTQPYTTVSGPSDGLFSFFRDDSSFPSVTVQPSPTSHGAAFLLELEPSDVDFWGWADDFGASDNGWAVFR